MAKARLNLSNFELKDFPINLIEAQLESYDLFLSKDLPDLFKEISPIEDYTGESWIMEFGKVRFGKVKHTAQEAQKLGLSYDTPMYIEVKLINKKTGEIKEQELFVADLPLMTQRGSFIINGHERVVVMQLVRAEGVLFVKSKRSYKKDLYAVKLIPQRGKWLDFEVSRTGVMSVQLVNKRPRILLSTLLRALGYSTDDEITSLLSDIDTGEIQFVDATLKADTTRSTEEALIDIYSKLRPEDSINLEGAKTLLSNIFFNPRRFFLGKVGRYQLNKKLGQKVEIKEENYVLKKEDIVSVIRTLIRLNNREIRPDDIDHLANRRVRGAGELIAESIRGGMLQMEKNIRDRMSNYAADELVTPSRLVNTRPVTGVLNHFFGSSSLSRYMDQENILSELSIKRRITSGGEGGLTKQSATFSVRDVHGSHYSRFCPVETPEGPMIGIVTQMAMYARINEHGFLEAPYRRVISTIGKKDQGLLAGRILTQDIKQGDKVVYQKGYKLNEKDAETISKLKVDEVKVKPFISDEMVYFAADAETEHIIGPATVNVDEDDNIIDSSIFARVDGGYKSVAAADVDFADVNPGQIAGLGLAMIPYAAHDDPTRTLMGSNMQKQAVPLLNPSSPIVGTGYEKLVARASERAIFAEDEGEVLYSDASEIEVKFKKMKKKTKFKLDKFVRTNQNTCFNQIPRVRAGEKFKKGDILVDGASMDHGELALGQNILAAYMVYEGMNYEDAFVISERLVKDDILTSVHINEYVRDIRETKLGPEQITTDIPNVSTYALRNLGEDGIVRIGARVEPRDILVGIIAPKGETELTAEEKLLRAIFGEYARDVRDNSLQLPHGERGIVIDTQVLDKEDGAKLAPGVLKQIKVWVARTHKVSIGDKLTGRHGDKGCICKILPVEDMPYLEDGTPVDIILSSPLFIKRMNLGQLMETHVGRIAQQLGIKVEVPIFAETNEDKVLALAKEKGISLDKKVNLYDGRTGKMFPERIVVGPRYILKLKHLADDKVHARSTGPYTMVTQQPLGGKAQFGGQRFGEMEVWALEAHTAPNVLQEMLTIKSDDVVGRAEAYKAIIQGLAVESPNIPESFKVLISELRSLGLNLEMVDGEVSEKPEVEEKTS
ncbi:DNA-directed RNA polymerase subunit beta [Candidatus Dojkabacteria bacterium]|nr:DNA-directed RNA polymerase subunit beta [Candidatus Dojkabacteria bacterium]